MIMKAIYHFSEGSRSMQELLGGKGANLAEMTNLGLPVPPGYIITTEACRYFLENNSYPQSFEEEHGTAIRQLENDMGKKFGDPADPLLVSVRSGAAVSMPGMMDTILNLGLNDESVEGLATKTQNPRFAYDAYRRFIQMFSNVVLGLDMEKFEHILEEAKKKRGYTQDTQLTAEDLKELIDMYKQIVMAETGQAFPSEPMRQLDLAILAVFGSWDN
ncbi:pyruvate, phosphate dikinase, partial [Candidatus Peregrinibacteria bacterium CG_4_10_14_0_2_um_filter_41_8]